MWSERFRFDMLILSESSVLVKWAIKCWRQVDWKQVDRIVRVRTEECGVARFLVCSFALTSHLCWRSLQTNLAMFASAWYAYIVIGEHRIIGCWRYVKLMSTTRMYLSIPGEYASILKTRIRYGGRSMKAARKAFVVWASSECSPFPVKAKIAITVFMFVARRRSEDVWCQCSYATKHVENMRLLLSSISTIPYSPQYGFRTPFKRSVCVCGELCQLCFSIRFVCSILRY